MGIIDDLAMGLGFKARTEDYDARTARNLRDYQGNAAAADQYLSSRGYDEGYRPQIAQDDRPFMQRLFTSPESQYSPTPYAIGPVRMNQAMSPLGPMGLLMRMMRGGSTQPTAEDIAFIRSIPQQEIGGGLLTEPAPMPTSVDTGVVDGEVESDMMYLNAEQPLSSYLKRYDPQAITLPPEFDMTDAPATSAPPPPSSSVMTEPYINFAQYVEAYRKKEAPFLKSGRLKQQKTLQELQRSYNEQFGIK